MNLTDIVNSYNKFLVNYIAKMVNDYNLANDLAQETWISIHTSEAKLDWSNPVKVLRMVARRRVIDYWRGQSKLPIQPINPDDYHNFWNDVAGKEDKDKTISKKVQRALDGLSDNMRKCVVLVLLDGYTHQEAADILGISIGTVLSRVHRAKTKLQNVLR